MKHFWVDEDASKEKLFYVLEHPDMASRERNFQAFLDEPKWQELRERTKQMFSENKVLDR
ncbi:hypothetical protein GT019_31255 [Paenibacillus sp. T1]|uniref:NIPSNAP domain-containing protein n=2 Tax=Paenibacillus glycinis TaxID=2697035 RepID=A0ABW9Y0G0_9BACL|nr:hypothetical protein [Paenibacillus glycinis]